MTVVCDVCGARGDRGWLTLGVPLQTYCPRCVPAAMARINAEPPEPREQAPDGELQIPGTHDGCPS